MTFNPDAWLAAKSGATAAPGDFDPDAYLKKNDPGFFAGLKGSLKRGLDQAGQAVDGASLGMAADLTEDARGEPERVAAERLADRAPEPKHFAPGAAGQRGYAAALQKYNLRESEREERLKNNTRFVGSMTAEKMPALAGAIDQRDKSMAEAPRTEAMQEWDKADSLGAALGVLARNPVEVIANVATEGLGSSAPALLATMTGSPAGPLGMAAGAGGGSLGIEYGGKIVEELRKAGADFAKPETLVPLLSDGKRMQAIRMKSVRRGVPVAFFDALSAGFAGRLFRKGASTLLGKAAQGATEMAVQGAAGGAGEAAGAISAGEPIEGKAVLAEVIGEVGSGAVEVATGMATRDTGKNKPERVQDLKAQQQQLVRGERLAQMFPTGTEELPLPEGMARVETPRGVFHFDPKSKAVTAEEIKKLSAEGKENTLLGLGPYGKEDIERRAAKGEPVAVLAERGPNGEELRGALVTPSTVDQTRDFMEAGKSKGSTVKLEPLQETLAKRDLADDIEAALPDHESRDYLRGRNRQDIKRQLEEKTALPEMLRTTVDDMVLTGIEPKTLAALDNNLSMLTDRAYRKRLGMSAKVTDSQINNVLGNTPLSQAIGSTRYYSLITELAKSPDNINALRAEIQRVQQTPAAPANLAPKFSRSELPDTSEAGRLAATLKLQEKIRADREQKAQAEKELQEKKAAAEKALKVAAEQRQAERVRMEHIERTGRDPESGLIADLRRVPAAELENFDWEKDRYTHDGDEVSPEDIDAVLAKRFADEERSAADQNSAGYTLGGLLRGKPAELRAAGMAKPLRLMSPKEARARGSFGGEHEALRERTGGFAFFARDGLVEDGLQERLNELGFDVPDTTAAYHLIERALAGDEVQPTRTERGQVQFARRKVDDGNTYRQTARRSEKATPQGESQAAQALPPDNLPAEGSPAVATDGAGRGLNSPDAATRSKAQLAAIEAKMSRGAVDRDRAVRAINRWIDVEQDKTPEAKWPVRWDKKGNPERVTITREEAMALRKAVDAFDAGGQFVWPDATMSKRLGVQFARRSGPERAAPDKSQAQWWRNFQKLAPGLAREFDLRFGNPDVLVDADLVRRDQLTGEEEAAYVANQKLFYLFDHALQANTETITRLNLQHEMGHAYWDTLDKDTQLKLHTLWRAEIAGRKGPLYDSEGNQREGVALGVEDDVKEWFAERMAHANDAWAKGRMKTARRGDTLIHTVAAKFREVLQRMHQLLEKLQSDRANYDNDSLLIGFRDFLEQGTRWNNETAEPPQFARRDAGDGFDAALSDFDRLERERDSIVDKGGKVPRVLLEQLSEARTTLENSWPGWREELKAKRAETEANAVPVTEPEPGATAAGEESEAINPDVTKFKQSQLEASSFRPPSRVLEWAGAIGRVLRNFRSAIPELPGGAAGRQFIQFRQGYRMLKAATENVRREAEERVAHVLEPLTKLGGEAIAPNEYQHLLELQARRKKAVDDSKPVPAAINQRIAELEQKIDGLPYHLFRKTVLYRDLWFRSKIQNPNGDPLTLPFHLQREEVETILRDLHAKIDASPARAAIEESLRRHYELVKSTREDLLERGYIIPEELRNPLYFPHLVLEKFNGRLARVKLDTAEDFRGYLQQLTGSAREIETDYLTAMYYHLGQVMAHNARQDIVETYWQPYDIKQELEDEAKELNQKRREQGLGPLHWRQLLPAGHVVYTVDDRIPLRPEYTVNRQVLASRLGVELGAGDLQAQLRELGLSVTLTAADFEAAMAAGEKRVWVLPKPVADALTGIMDRDAKTRGNLSLIFGSPQGLWKRWILYAPHNVIRYTYGNLVADLEKLFSVDPAVFKNLRGAFREVREFAAGGKPSADLQQAFQRGVIQSVTAAEVSDLAQAERFEDFLTDWGRLKNTLSRGIQWGRTVNELRESAFRFAKFKTDLERMRNGARPIYAGAYSRDVEAIKDSKPGAGDAIFAKAAEITRKTFVDYDDLSVSGDALRRYWVPFYSWLEGNFKYHANLFRNLADQSVGAGLSQISRGGLVAASKVIVPRSVAGVLMRLALPYVAVGLWNNSDDREELEKNLSAEDRRRFHVILGKDENGKTMVVYAPTALSDVAGWFGGNEFARLAGDYFHGRITLPQLAHEWISNTPGDVLNKAVQGISPQAKAIYIAASRRNPFPDFFDQRTIADHDLNWAILGGMTDGATADWLRRAIDKDYYSPRDFGDWAQQLILQVRRRDPEQWGYYATLDRVETWQKAHGGVIDFGANNKADAELLTSFRRTLRAGDVPAAISFYHKLLDAGYTSERFAASVRAADPLQTMKREFRQQFHDELSPAERQDMVNAYRYVQRIEVFKNRERQLFPGQKASAAYKERFADNPRDDLFAGLMLEADGREDGTEELRAEQLMGKALRPR